MKLLSHSGYDYMRMYVEESPWWVRFFRLEPRVKRYSGSEDVWFHEGVQVGAKKAAALKFLWLKARNEQKAALRQARAR